MKISMTTTEDIEAKTRTGLTGMTPTVEVVIATEGTEAEVKTAEIETANGKCPTARAQPHNRIVIITKTTITPTMISEMRGKSIEETIKGTNARKYQTIQL